eukprot:TRINITY_DN313_c0_g3_i1.p1 TRINITY_DN313_c0_g3~~TRINITY_DN313_c0_g3_i1.p1  ORF type:complete len:260 (-),score=43.07 TRINITY_DN313_c0_g3_i1:332-1111(-)
MRYLIERPEVLQEARVQPLKVYYCGPMFRHDRPQKGRYREFIQFGIEHIGSNSVVSDAENILLADRILKELNAPSYKLHINSIGTAECRKAYNDQLRKYFTQPSVHCKLSQESKEKLETGSSLLRILDSKYREDIDACKDAPRISDYLNEESKGKLERTLNILQENEVDYTIDDKLVRGLDYYNDVCYEFKLRHEKLGPSQNTVIGGGRYNGLSEMLGGRQVVAASGWAAGINRLIEVIPMPPFENDNKIDIVLALVEA